MATGYLVRTGTGIADVAWKGTPVIGDKLFTSNQQWTVAQAGSTYNALYRFGGGISDVRYQNVTFNRLLSNLSPGDIVKIKESGTAQEFVVLVHNYPASERTLIIRKLCKARHTWTSYGSPNDYDGSGIDTYLNEDYFDMLDTAISSKISAVPIKYNVSSSGVFSVKTIQRKIFLLSSPEVGFTNNNKGEGMAIPYFNSDSRRIAYYIDSESGTLAEPWWTRSVYMNNAGSGITGIAFVSSTGKLGSRTASLSPTQFARPAFTLPSNTVVDSSGNIVV